MNVFEFSPQTVLRFGGLLTGNASYYRGADLEEHYQPHYWYRGLDSGTFCRVVQTSPEIAEFVLDFAISRAKSIMWRFWMESRGGKLALRYRFTTWGVGVLEICCSDIEISAPKDAREITGVDFVPGRRQKLPDIPCWKSDSSNALLVDPVRLANCGNEVVRRFLESYQANGSGPIVASRISGGLGLDGYLLAQQNETVSITAMSPVRALEWYVGFLKREVP